MNEFASAMAVALEAQRLVELRDRWLNPTERVEWVDEPVPSYPKCLIPRDEAAAKALKKRTLTNLYTARRGSPTPTQRSTLRSRLPTAGVLTLLTTTSSRSCWNSTSAVWNTGEKVKYVTVTGPGCLSTTGREFVYIHRRKRSV